MSNATSIRGKQYSSSFIEGFRLQNSQYMLGGDFIFSEFIVKRDGQILGDIDAHYVSTADKLLKELLPKTIGLLRNNSFLIPNNTNVFIELTTTEGQNLVKADNNYIERKIKFYDKILRAEADNFNAPANHILVFIFNGADHTLVEDKFQSFAKNYGINGVTIYVGNDAMLTWRVDLELYLSERELEAAEIELKEVKAELRRVRELQEETDRRNQELLAMLASKK